MVAVGLATVDANEVVDKFVFGDHVIRKKVEYKEPDFKEVLGEKGCDMIVEAYPWFYELFEYEK